MTRNLFGMLALAGCIGLAGSAIAAEKVECRTMKDGKKTTQMVESEMACTKLGGTVAHKAKSWNEEHTPAKLHHTSQK